MIEGTQLQNSGIKLSFLKNEEETPLCDMYEMGERARSIGFFLRRTR